MHLFISAGEPSGDLHGSNLVAALRRVDPGATLVGFGGERMEAAGCRLVYPLTRLAVMWFARALANFFTFARLLRDANRYFREHRPDAVVLIDYPGFHFLLAKRAKAHGIPVVWFVPPQLWAWAGWRVKKVRRSVSRVLCSLPFEPGWYAERGVTAEFVGHPYFDELPRQRLDGDFLADQRRRGGRAVALLPGSRGQEVERNLPTLLDAARRIRAGRPDARFLFACFNEHHAEVVAAAVRAAGLPDGAVEVHARRTPEVIEAAEFCVAVSGSVGLELLYRAKPTVVVYRVGRFDLLVARRFIKCRFISIVNLLASEEVFPEFLTTYDPGREVADRVLAWLNDAAAADAVRGKLRALCQRSAAPGACERAAARVAELVGGPGGVRRAA